MTVQAIRLGNFMAFQDTGWIELRSICLLFGLNSSGKSAIIRALRLLKQSLDFEAGEGPLCFNVENHLDLDNIRNTRHHPDRTRWDSFVNDQVETERVWLQAQRLTFAFRCELSTPDRKHIWERLQQTLQVAEAELPSYAELNLQFSHDDKDRQHPVKLVACWLDYPITLSDQEIKTTLFMLSLQEFLERKLDSSFPDFSLEWDKRWYWESDYGIGDSVATAFADQFGLSTEKSFLPQFTRLNNIDIHEDMLKIQSDFVFCGELLESLSKTIREFLSNIIHLGPLRPAPQRLYMLDRHKVQLWRKQGWSGLIDLLVTPTPTLEKQVPDHVLGAEVTKAEVGGEDDTQYLSESTTNAARGNKSESERSQFLQDVDRWMQNLRLGMQIHTNPTFPTNAGDFASSLIIGKNNGRDSLLDVGFGASQVLPIILACLSAKPGQLVIIEQPELHLHPSAQAELGDLFMHAVMELQVRKPKDNNEDSDGAQPLEYNFIPLGVRVLVETHSEHLLHRFRRRIAETSLYQQKVVKYNREIKSGESHRLDILPPQEVIFAKDFNPFLVVKESSCSKLLQMGFDEWGRYVEQPEEFQTFFSQDLDELMAIDDARLESEEE